MVLRIAICEDESKDIDVLKGYINALSSNYPYFRIKIDVYRSGDTILSHYNRAGKHDYYDLIFFDKDLGDTDGIETAHKIREYDSNALFVYVTNFSQYISNASETDMFRYLIKPVRQDKFNEVFDFAVRRINTREKTFAFTSNYTPYRLFAREIMYFERVAMKTFMYTADGEVHALRNLLSEILDDLGDYGFILVHRSIVVNLAYVREVKYEHLVLHNKKVLNVSRNKSPAVKNRFLEYKYGRNDV